MVIKIVNLDKLVKNLKGYENLDLMPVIKDGTERVQVTAKLEAPRDTGNLANSVQMKLFPEQESGIVFTILEYAIYQEFGTRYQKGKPFMRPALEQNRAYINESMKKYIKAQLTKKNG